MYDVIGQEYGAYTLLKIEELPNLNGKGYVFSHTKTKARVAVVSNDDDNKVFTIGFRTPVYNDTGVPHIMEHSVLCGSEKFPIKDPFVELAKGSLNTFLNAMTYPDKTVYPIASCNNQDFQNLMDVYLDAVFHPNIYKYPEIMKQEGWHYELESKDEDIIYNGVVYNEMKGVFSNPESVLDRFILSTLYPDTTYFYESGGDPKAIPDLTYEQFIEFHKTYYHPSNSYIYLYGDLDIEEKLKFIDEEYLSHYDYLDVDSKIGYQLAFDEMKEFDKEYAIAQEEDEKEKTYLSYNISIGESTDAKLASTLSILEYVLLAQPGAPLREALLDAGIGQDVYSQLENDIAQPVLSIIATNTEADKKDEFVKIITDKLKEFADKGLDKKAIKAAINLFEFQYREANFGSYPKGLMYGLKILGSWIYDEDAVFNHINLEDIFKELKEGVDSGYFENALREHIIDNTHVSLIVMTPKKGLTQLNDNQVKEKLSSLKASMSDDEIDKMVEDTKNLRLFQDREDSEEDINKIPLLKLSDLDSKIRPYTNKLNIVEGVKLLWHPIFTNNITYMCLHFDMRALPVDLIPVSSILVNLLRQVDTEHYSYQDLNSEFNLYTGGISIGTSAYKNERLPGGFGAGFNVRVKFLDEQLDKTFELIRELLFTSKFTDDKRIKQIVNEQRIGVKQQLVSSGHIAMANRASSKFDQGSKFKDLTDMMGYYEYLVDLSDNFDERIEQLKVDLHTCARFILTKKHLTVSVTCNDDISERINKPLAGLISDLYDDIENELIPVIDLNKDNEGFKTSSQVQYVASAGNYSEKGYKYTGALNVLKMIFSYEYLWMNVRVKGGAYGCGCTFGRYGNGFFSSYRDPNLEDTFNVFSKAADYVESFDVDDRTMLKYIIGAISSMDTPLTPSAWGSASFAAYLSDLTDEMRQQDRDEVLATNVDRIRELAPIVRAVADYDAYAVIGNEDKIEAEQQHLTSVKNLA
ncbi:MAG: insulinase family protein [Lachnospiraceae bacterium]|nr:insulinase family protein [Lachnospiraceae bacterium]